MYNKLHIKRFVPRDRVDTIPGWRRRTQSYTNTRYSKTSVEQQRRPNTPDTSVKSAIILTRTENNPFSILFVMRTEKNDDEITTKTRDAYIFIYYIYIMEGDSAQDSVCVCM